MSEPSIRFRWMDAVLDTPSGQIDAYARAVAFVLLQHMNPDGVCRPSTRRLAAMSGCSRPVVIERLRRLEEAGLLTVERRTRAVSGYRAVVASGQSHEPVDHPTGQPDEPDNPDDLDSPVDQTPEHEPQLVNLSADLVNPVDSEPYEPLTPTSRIAVAQEARGEPPDLAPRPRVTRRRLWATMAERQLTNQREAGWSDMPPPGSYREERYLEKLRSEFETQHTARALELHGRFPADDIERWIYELDPSLSKHGYGPGMALGERYWAEYRASVPPAMTDDELGRVHQRTLETKARLRAMQRERRQHDQVPA